ncbi:hypothetical protein DFQ28_010851 [Apophysomyces sp. BC1034]|nr:hypothetical protein DFQ29_005823 [Apophysomyces sp. BC1021]KAG0191822.1 hypothetical protein DFQ28_010851 [Apophysomyces sp. BC1034]
MEKKAWLEKAKKLSSDLRATRNFKAWSSPNVTFSVPMVSFYILDTTKYDEVMARILSLRHERDLLRLSSRLRQRGWVSPAYERSDISGRKTMRAIILQRFFKPSFWHVVS